MTDLPTREQIRGWWVLGDISNGASEVLYAYGAGDLLTREEAANDPEVRKAVLQGIWSFHPDGSEYINADLEASVARVIRRYPNTEAPMWLGPVVAIRTVYDWLQEVTDDD